MMHLQHITGMGFLFLFTQIEVKNTMVTIT